MTYPKVRRSALYTPGTNATALLKAARSAADVLIFDLEDAVAPDSKVEARRTVARALVDPALAGRQIVVRVNGIGTDWCEDDVKTMAGLGAAAMLFPKISTEDDVKVAEAMLDFHGAPRSTELWCMVETPQAILNAQPLGQMARRPGSRMSTWVLGTNDLVKELKARHTPLREGLLPMLAMALLGARAAGLSVLDGVHNNVKDTESFERVCAQGREMGFDGKTLIHPSQVGACNRIFSPTSEEVQEAQWIVDAFALPEHHGKGVIQLNGRMVELLHAEIARQTLEMARAIDHIVQSRGAAELQPEALVT